jgi:hypothetical protein
MQNIQQIDSDYEYAMRLQLREVLTQTLDLLTNPDANEYDANRITALIREALKQSAP